MSSQVIAGNPLRAGIAATAARGVYLESEADEGYVFVKVGTLDDPSWVKPEMHIFVAAQHAWMQITDGLPQFEGMPPTD